MAECYTHHGSSCKGDCDPKDDQIASLRSQLADAREKLADFDNLKKLGTMFSLEALAMLNGWAAADPKEKKRLWQALHAENARFWEELTRLNNGHHPALPAPAAEGEKPGAKP